MKKIYLTICLLIAAFAFYAVDVNAQTRYVDVAPGPLGTLNDAINGDTLENGERNDPDNTVYRLERGPEAYYLLNGSIENRYPLTIVAADGDGARPFIQPGVPEGGESARAFRPRDNITLMGLHVTNMDNGGGLNTRILRCSADDITVVLDDCWFDKDGQSWIRCDNPGMTFKVTNCVISNIGHPSSPNNGRGIDDRGNDIDTIIFENNTFYNITSRVIRDGGGTIDYARVNMNTFVNLGQMGLTFGSTSMLEIKDNIFMNAGFMPSHSVNDLGRTVVSIDSVIIDSVTKVAPVVIMSNMSVGLDTAAIAGYLNDTTVITPLLNPTMLALALQSGGLLTMLQQTIEFTDGPAINDSLIIYDLGIGGLDQQDAPPWPEPDVAGVGEGGNGVYHLDVPYDFGYANTAAYGGGSDGMQLGDRNWEASISVAVRSFRSETLGLSAYPMPVKDQMTIDFSLEESALVQMEVYSLTGQRVADVLHTQYQPGSHQVSWNADLLKEGMYILRMKAGSQATTIKMIIQ